eukprot:s3061_g1.t1
MGCGQSDCEPSEAAEIQDAFPPALDLSSSKRRILTAVNVARDPEAAITAMVTPIVQLCDIEDVILLDEYIFPPIPSLASSKVRSLELRFTPNTAPLGDGW